MAPFDTAIHCLGRALYCCIEGSHYYLLSLRSLAALKLHWSVSTVAGCPTDFALASSLSMLAHLPGRARYSSLPYLLMLAHMTGRAQDRCQLAYPAMLAPYLPMLAH